MAKLFTVVGMGNRLCGDDAIGPLVLDALRGLDDARLELIEGGVDALALLDIMAEKPQVIVVDATRMGLSPGALRVFQRDQCDLIVEQDHLSLHSLGLAEVLQLGEQFEMLPKNLKFVGIQPLSVEVDAPVSDVVTNAIPAAVDLILDEVDRMQALSNQSMMTTDVGQAHEDTFYA